MNTPIRTTTKKKGSLRRTPYGNSSACFAPFKSPLTSKSPQTSKVSLSSKENVETQESPAKEKFVHSDENALLEEISELKKFIASQNEEITEFSEKADKRKKMNKLHEYNELKDIGQMVMGRLAELEGTT